MAQHAARIFTVSSFSKSEIVKWFGASPENIIVTYLGCEHMLRLEGDRTVLERMGISGRFVLAASSHQPNKNFARVAEAFGLLDLPDLQFVIAGGKDTKVYGRDFKPLTGVRSLGYVSDEELKALYEGASCFVFASLYEGFGLPPLEAMASGCPVAVARAASLPELYTGRAIFCDPWSPEDIAAAVSETLKCPAVSVEESKAFAKTFRWTKCARETLEAMLSL
jgi:glycosyltransferase involved in cell wall biosynthesis